jgi:hypothetical protein
MRIFSFAALAIGAYGQSVMLDENTPCSDFANVFGSFDGMKTKCKGKSNKKKTKQFCNLICENGQENVWSTRPIKCKAKKSGVDVGKYKWRPSKIKNADDLCNPKEKCPQLKTMYNVTNKLLSWEKSVVGRRTFYNFTCDDMESNGKTFKMMPYPTDHVTCTCNTNKPSNVRCKWMKVKNSIVRCVRADKAKFHDEGGNPAFYDDMYDSSY